uniref:Uncharacterized protein n=1 Tax=Globodera rostochiensis TaxID=31243 RepID=A0A914HNZ7_GLORO
MRLLRARIAELERQQTINSPASCRENLKKMELELMKVKEEMKNAKLEHENKELRAELAHQKLLNAHMVLQTKMEEYQNKQQQNIDDLTEKLKVSIDQFSLKNQEELEKLSNVHKKQMEEMKEQQKMDAWKQQKETNDKIDSLKKDHQEQFANMIRKMEQKQNDAQEELECKMDDSVIQAMVVAKLGEQKASNCNKFVETEQNNVLQQEKILKLEQDQKEQQLYIIDLQKNGNFGLKFCSEFGEILCLFGVTFSF